MRILALVTDTFGGFGGIAQYNQHFLSALADAEGVTEVIVLPRDGTVTSEAVPAQVKQLAPQPNKGRYTARAMLEVLINGRFNIIFCGHLYMAPLAALLGGVFRIPVWLQLHGIEAWDRPSRIQQWAAERSAFVTVVSRYTRRRFLTWASLPPERVKVLPNTVEEKFKPGPKPANLLKRFGLEGKKILLTVSRLSATERYKGHDKVIALLPELQKEYPNLVYVIAGDGDDGVRLETLAAETGVGHGVAFVGRIAREELPDLYRIADVFVMPSTGEGFGIVFLEAMACGIPAIGGCHDGSVDALGEGNLGVAVDEMTFQDATIAALAGSANADGNLETRTRHLFGYSNFSAQVNRLATLFTTLRI